MFENISNNSPVVVIGLGLTGTSCIRYCLSKGWPVIAMDTRTNPANLAQLQSDFNNVEFISGGLDQLVLENAGLIIVSPGVDLRLPEIQRAKRTVSVVGDIELFAHEVKVPIVAITGSNGKSTVCDWLGYICQKSGVETKVAGNIGTPVLDLLSEPSPQLYILELSSFQLESLYSLNADVGCVLNISPDHLDRYDSYQDYVNTKLTIYSLSKIAVINSDESLTQDIKSAHTITFGRGEQNDFRVVTDDSGFFITHRNKIIVREAEMNLTGIHNGLNAAACLAILHALAVDRSESVIQALKSYSGLSHRCQVVETNDNIIWINDSKGTNVGATITAIESIYQPNKNIYLIAGGDAKGADISQLSEIINKKIKYAWIFGKDSNLFESQLDNCEVVADLPTAVHKASISATAGDTVLFSPACASLDMYKNYQARGNHFVDLLRGAA
ncbi:MAG: UDP-N-acetylmuramoyl-L-alanine--D-glutamate ligase [Kangiellaceae bacterium]|jgi:UDP-N-acetylmuramoylalanine--D-glutamate ligase|nr:UDP-N-acetylmuramoyl-L-alanine--D-glutamate ligase [Kangiellaceae bacterium]